MVEIVRKERGKRMSLAKPPKWSHQDDLVRAVRERRIVALHILTGPDRVTITGQLLQADNFALKVAVGDKSVITYYKHAIVGYEIK